VGDKGKSAHLFSTETRASSCATVRRCVFVHDYKAAMIVDGQQGASEAPQIWTCVDLKHARVNVEIEKAFCHPYLINSTI